VFRIEIVFTALICLAGIVSTVLTCRPGRFLTALLFLTGLVLVVLIFLTGRVLAAISYWARYSQQTALEYAQEEGHTNVVKLLS
jgi:hypothetical protein